MNLFNINKRIRINKNKRMLITSYNFKLYFRMIGLFPHSQEELVTPM